MDFGTHDYIGTRECGCTVVLIADIPSLKKDTAKRVAQCIKDGMTVERLPRAEAVARMGRKPDCPIHGKKQAQMTIDEVTA